MLGTVTKGKQDAPLKEFLYGVEGVGKSSWASEAPNPIYLGEDGTKKLAVARFAPVENWPDATAAVQELITEKHDYQTLVVDTVDHLETVLWKHICNLAEEVSIEAVGGGYGKGYIREVELWRDYLKKLDELQAKRGMHVILIGHAQSEKYSPPMGEEYDRFGPKIHKKSASLIKGWAESVLFAAYKDTVKKGRGFKSKAADAYQRVLYTTRAAAADAKNRYGLPAEIELSFPEYWNLIHREETERLASIRKECDRLIPDIRAVDRRVGAAKFLATARTIHDVRRAFDTITRILEEQDEEGEAKMPGEQPAPAATPPGAPMSSLATAPAVGHPWGAEARTSTPPAPTITSTPSVPLVTPPAAQAPTTATTPALGALAVGDPSQGELLAKGWPPAFVAGAMELGPDVPLGVELKVELFKLATQYFNGSREAFAAAWEGTGYTPPAQAGPGAPQPTGLHLRRLMSRMDWKAKAATALVPGAATS